MNKNDRLERMSYKELLAERMVLTNEYYYWMDREDVDDEILEDIEAEIQYIETLLSFY